MVPMSNDYLPEDYTPVHERVEEFREDYPKGKILTDIYKWEQGLGVFRARIEDEEGNTLSQATGHATEEADSFVGSKYYEKGETVAVGRALAFAGYGIQEGLASKEEVESVRNQKKKGQKKNSKSDTGLQDASGELTIDLIQQRLNAREDQEWFSDPSSDKQRGMFASWWKENVGGGDEMRYYFLSRLLQREITSTKDLTKGELSTLIELANNQSRLFTELIKETIQNSDAEENLNDEEIPF